MKLPCKDLDTQLPAVDGKLELYNQHPATRKLLHPPTSYFGTDPTVLPRPYHLDQAALAGRLHLGGLELPPRAMRCAQRILVGRGACPPREIEPTEPYSNAKQMPSATEPYSNANQMPLQPGLTAPRSRRHDNEPASSPLPI